MYRTAAQHADLRWAVAGEARAAGQSIALADQHVRLVALSRRTAWRALADGLGAWSRSAEAERRRCGLLAWAQWFLTWRALARGFVGWASDRARRRHADAIARTAALHGYASAQLARWRALYRWRGRAQRFGRQRIEQARRARDEAAAPDLLSSLDWATYQFCRQGLRSPASSADDGDVVEWDHTRHRHGHRGDGGGIYGGRPKPSRPKERPAASRAAPPRGRWRL